MKNPNKILALLLTLALLLCLCACGNGSGGGGGVLRSQPESFETRLVRAQKQMEELKSFHMDMSLDMHMTMKMMGQSLDMVLIADYAMDTEQDPLKLAMDLHMDITAMGQHQEEKSLVYVVRDGDRFLTYTSTDGGKTWDKASSPTPEISQQNTEEQMALFLACGDSFQEAGTRMVNGAPAVAYQGKLSGDFVQQAIQSSGSLDSLGELLGSDIPEELFQGLGDIPVTVAFDQASGMMVYYEMDMSEAMSVLMQRLMQSVMQSFGLEGVEVNLTAAKVSATLSGFDQVSVVVPAID